MSAYDLHTVSLRFDWISAVLEKANETNVASGETCRALYFINTLPLLKPWPTISFNDQYSRVVGA